MKLKIACLNTWNYHQWNGRKDKMIHFFKEMDADVLLLQEINDDPRHNSPGNDIAHQLNAVLNYPHLMVFFNSVMDKKTKPELGELSYKQGIAILSKYPLTDVVHHHLAQMAEDPYRRGIVIAKVNAGKGFDVLNLHFSNRSLWANKHWEETKELIATLHRRPIIAGDFNMKRADIRMMTLPLRYSSPYLEQEYTSYPGDNEAYDLAIFPEDMKLLSFECVDVNISDHRPLVFEIEV